MNVLHVHSGNLYGGVETFLLTLARSRELAPGMDMSVALCFEGRVARDLRAARMMPVLLGEVRLRRPDKVRRARQELRSLLATHSFDIAVCHQAWPHAIFGSVLKGAGIPLVSWVHMAQTGGHWLDRLAGRIEPDCYVCNSKYTASLLPPTNARVEVIYAPVAPHAPHASAFARTSPIATADKPNAPIAIARAPNQLLEDLKARRSEVESLAKQGSLGAIYIPALQAKDLALEIQSQQQGADAESVEASVKQIVLAAYQLDNFGDLGDGEKVQDAYRNFSAAILQLDSLLSGRR